MWETEPAPLLSLTIRRPRRCPCLHTTTTIIAAALSARRSHTIMNAPHSLYCRSFRVHETSSETTPSMRFSRAWGWVVGARMGGQRAERGTVTGSGERTPGGVGTVLLG